MIISTPSLRGRTVVGFRAAEPLAGAAWVAASAFFAVLAALALLF
jgi:hypothetical protein